MKQLHGVVIVTILFGLLGQIAKSHPSIKNWIPQTAMVLVGLLFYAGNYGFPHSAANTFVDWFAAITDWLEAAGLAAAAIPGTASLFGMIPALKTQTLPRP